MLRNRAPPARATPPPPTKRSHGCFRFRFCYGGRRVVRRDVVALFGSTRFPHPPVRVTDAPAVDGWRSGADAFGVCASIGAPRGRLDDACWALLFSPSANTGPSGRLPSCTHHAAVQYTRVHPCAGRRGGQGAYSSTRGAPRVRRGGGHSHAQRNSCVRPLLQSPSTHPQGGPLTDPRHG